MKISFYYSSSAQKKHFISTGENLPAGSEIEYNPLELTPSQRELIYGCDTISIAYNRFDYPCTIEDILDYLEIKHQKDLEQCNKEIRSALDRIEELERESVESISDMLKLYTSRPFNFRAYDGARKLLLKHADLPIVGVAIEERLRKIDEKIQAAESIFEAKKIEQERQRVENEEKSQQQKELYRTQRQTERRNWIDMYGDERLKLADANGYECQRLYVIARAKHEYPEFILDFDDNWGYKTRVGPTLAAFKLLEKYPESTIVWITKSPDDRYDDGGLEAIVIQDFLGKYDLLLPVKE